jgi:phosphatidylinositol alpha 1,6-mannosyltransferase
LRLAIFTGNYNYIRDGVAVTLNRLVAHLEKSGIEVLIFAPTAKTPAMVHAGELVSVPSIAIPFHSEYRLALRFPKAAQQRLLNFKPDLMLLAAPDILGQRALQFAKAHKIPVVASYHTRLDTYLKFYGLGFLENWGRNYLARFYAQVLVVYPPSESMADILREHGIAQFLEVWGRGVDSNLFNPTKRSMVWRREHGFGDDEVVVSFVSRLVKEKNTDILARVLKQINAKALIVGTGPEEDYLKQALPQAVFAGFLQGEDLARAYASSDIFLFPSESETFGNVTLEAMASGLPAVCALATGSNSLVIEGKTGFLVDARQEDEMVEKVQMLITNTKLRQTMSNAARARALEFNWDAILNRLVASFKNVISKK